MDFDKYILILLILLPFIGALITLAMGKTREKYAKYTALVFALATAVVALYITYRFLSNDYSSICIDEDWIVLSANGQTFLTIHMAFAIDGLSVLMVLLTSILVMVVEIFSFTEGDRPNYFHTLILAMELGLLGVYTAQDYFLFYIMWEITLIPMFFMISWYGGPRRHYSAIKFFIYTHVASLVMLIGIFILVFQASGPNGLDFSMAAVQENMPGFMLANPTLASIAFGLLLFGFIVKMPIVPFHTWLPDAHVEAPTAGSVLLAGVMLKMGSYGILRVCIGNFANAQTFGMFDDVKVWGWALVALGVLSMIYGAYACIAQKDLKKMVAYSSISHMGMVLMGIGCYMLTGHTVGLTFAVFQMFAHGLITAVLFMVCGLAGHNFGTREIPLLGGLAGKFPKWAFFMMFGFMASLGLPGLVGFVAEFGLLYSLWDAIAADQSLWILIIFGMLSMMLTAGYYLWAMQRTLFGKLTDRIDLEKCHDINITEFAAMAIMCALIAFFGIMPMCGTSLIDLSWITMGVL